MDLKNYKAITIPEGEVKQISVGGVVIWKKSRLPSEYQEVEYLEATGEQYIDTGRIFSNKADLIVETQIQWTRYRSRQLFGSADGSYYWGIQSNGKYELGLGVVSNISANLNDYDAIKFERKAQTNTATLYVNGNIAANRTNQTNSPRAAFIFDANDGTLVRKYLCAAKIKYYSIKYGSTEMLLLPCRRKADNEAGLYDIVNGVFYTNAGTGEFLVGRDV